MQLTAKLIEQEAAALDEGGGTRKVTFRPRHPQENRHWAWARQCGNKQRLEAMLNVAAPHLTVGVADLDGDPWLLNVENGTLVLNARVRGGIGIKLADRADRITRYAPVVYDPAAEAPRWRLFLDQVLPDPDVQTFLQVWAGYNLTGLVSEQKLLILYGRGANGKTTFMDILIRLLGSYALTMPFASLVYSEHRRGSDATPDLARLLGIRFAAASEPEVGVRLSESLVKQMTGGERLVVRHLNKEFFEFLPQFKLMVALNNRPQIRGQDEGIWRRILILAFPTIIPPDERDKDLLAKLWEERSGVLNWALDGLRIWRENGLVIPEAVRKATADYRSESDSVGQFLESSTSQVGSGKVAATELYNAYKLWCTANAFDAVSLKVFGRIMTERGYERSKVGIMYYVRLEITDAEILHKLRGGLDAAE